MSRLRAKRIKRQKLEAINQTAIILIVGIMAGVYIFGALLMLQGVI